MNRSTDTKTVAKGCPKPSSNLGTSTTTTRSSTEVISRLLVMPPRGRTSEAFRRGTSSHTPQCTSKTYWSRNSVSTDRSNTNSLPYSSTTELRSQKTLVLGSVDASIFRAVPNRKETSLRSSFFDVRSRRCVQAGRTSSLWVSIT